MTKKSIQRNIIPTTFLFLKPSSLELLQTSSLPTSHLMHQGKLSRRNQLDVTKPKYRINHHRNISESNINDYIYHLQETGEESFNLISYISETVIISPNPSLTQRPPMSSPVLSKHPTQYRSFLPSNTMSTKPSVQQSIIPTIFLFSKPSLL